MIIEINGVKAVIQNQFCRCSVKTWTVRARPYFFGCLVKLRVHSFLNISIHAF